MGKYPASDFLNKYSDWHWKNAGKWCYLTDIDRLWVEVRNFKGVLRPKIITDIKEKEIRLLLLKKLSICGLRQEKSQSISSSQTTTLKTSKS